jgi:hypothetical protein
MGDNIKEKKIKLITNNFVYCYYCINSFLKNVFLLTFFYEYTVSGKSME